MQKKALLFTTIQGHATLSSAFADLLKKNGWNVTEVKYHSNSKIHSWLHRHSIWFMRLISKPLLHPAMVPIEKKLLTLRYKKFIKWHLDKNKPNLVVSTFYLLNPSIEFWKEKNNFKFINVLTDPNTFLPLNPSVTADTNFVFDKNQENKLQTLYPNIKTTIIGWLTQNRFKKETNTEKIRKQLKITATLPTLLFSSGSLGNQFSSNLILFLLNQNLPCQILFVTGSNTKLKKKVESFGKWFPNSKIKITTFEYVENMNELMAASDLVIGKAGPNTLFESVLSLKPFLATNYGGTQESGNIELIKKAQLGYTAKHIFDATKILDTILKNPRELDRFKKPLQEMKNYLLQSDTKVLKAIEKINR